MDEAKRVTGLDFTQVVMLRSKCQNGFYQRYLAGIFQMEDWDSVREKSLAAQRW